MPARTNGSTRRPRTSSPTSTWPARRRCSAPLAASTPDIGFYGEEGGGGLRLGQGLGWGYHRRHYQLCDRVAAVRSDGRPARGRRADTGRDRPAVPRRGVDSGAVADVGAFEKESSGWATASARGGTRLDAYLELTVSVHRQAMRFRCVGAASVLWTWLVSGQIQGMVLAHNNPYDVVAGHAIARRRARCHGLCGRPAVLGSAEPWRPSPASKVNSSDSPPISPPRQRATAKSPSRRLPVSP